MSTRLWKGRCPQCGKTLTATYPWPYAECDCHLYCSDGSKPIDCSVTTYNYNGQLGWPTGIDNDPANELYNPLNATGYCSIHNKYVEKTPIVLEIDWEQWFSFRAPVKYRTIKK